MTGDPRADQPTSLSLANEGC